MSIITISGGIETSSLEIADLLSKKLGYTLLSREMVINESAKKYNILEKNLLDKVENTPSLWQKFTSEYEQYLIYIKCALLNAAKQDNIFYHGNTGQFFLKGIPHVLKIRVEASQEHRIKSIMSHLNYNHNQSVEYLQKTDDQRKRWVKMVYNMDWHDPSFYDLCFNMQTISVDNMYEIVTAALKHDNFKTTDRSVNILNNLSLECEVKAALTSDDKIWRSQQISVSAHNGVITLRGTTKNQELKDLIVDTTLKVKGVSECISDISLLSDPLT